VIEKLKENQNELNRMHHILIELEEKPGLFGHFKYKRLSKKQKKLQDKQFNLTSTYLEKNDTVFHELIQRNYELLSQENIRFKIADFQRALSFSSYTTNFRGNIHKNGYLYCHVTKGNFPLPFSPMGYPSKMKGKIDCWGGIHLSTISSGFALFKTLPTIMEGPVDTSGVVRLQTVSTEYDILNGGDLMVTKLIANVFEKKPQHRKLFFENKNFLMQLTKEFQKNLLK
jgi:hypothetical protein